MATTDTTSPGTGRSPGRGANVTLWVLQGLLALAFAGAGVSKLAGVEMHVEMFDDIGLGQWLRYLTGSLELAGAVGLLIPRLSALAAAGLALVMVGAAITDTFIIDGNPIGALVLLVLSAVVAWGRRGQIMAVLGRTSTG